MVATPAAPARMAAPAKGGNVFSGTPGSGGAGGNAHGGAAFSGNGGEGGWAISFGNGAPGGNGGAATGDPATHGAEERAVGPGWAPLDPTASARGLCRSATCG